MPLFAAIAAGLALLVLGAVLWPLWRGAAGRRQRALLLGIVLALGLTTFALYRLVGMPAALEVPTAAPQTPQEAVAQLEAALARNPERADGWVLLARSYAMLERPADARRAYARALKLMPDEPDLLVEAAQSRLMADPRKSFDAETVAMLKRALELQPANQHARWFLGTWHRQNGRAAEAATTWEPLLTQVTDQAAVATLRVQIDAARKEAGLSPLPAAAADAAPAGLTVKVALDADFAARVRLRGDTSVFVIARVPGGPPMPVAVEKHRLQDLPLTVVLDDGDSPMPTQKLSALKEVEVFARLSESGQAMRQPGDVDSEPVRVALPAKAPVDVVLGRPE
ncbi:tetratricopeptide repeat protein [Luteimonas aquatica]|uniref:tetratricopeptide repeat protein n=1 Tax=Luteimonas aquatica TaxID=450364 RepID=UPI003CE56975